MLDTDAIRTASALLRGVLDGGQSEWDSAPEERVVAALQSVADLSRVVDGLKVAAAGALARRSEQYTRAESLANRLGQSGPKKLLSEIFGVNFYQAASWVELAQATEQRFSVSGGELPPLRPALAAALRGGQISVDTAKVIHDRLKELTQESIPGGIDAAEAALVANATGGRINLFTPPPEAAGMGSEGGDGLGARDANADSSLRSLPSDRDWCTTFQAAPSEASSTWAVAAAHRSPDYSPILPPGMQHGFLGSPIKVLPPLEGSRASANDGAFATPADGSDKSFGGGFAGRGTPVAGGRSSLQQLKAEAQGWALVLDPDGAEPNYEQQRRQRSFRLGKAAGGGYTISGFAPEVEGAALRTLLDAYLAPRTRDPQALPSAESAVDQDQIPGLPSALGFAPDQHQRQSQSNEDGRTRDQKAFDALAQIFRLHAASEQSPRIGGAAPTLLITTTLEALDGHLAGCAEHEKDAAVASRHAAFRRPKRADRAGNASTAGNGRRDERTLRPWPTSVSQLPLDTNGIPDPQHLIDRRFARIGLDATPVPPSAVMHLLCDAAIQMLLTDQRGVPMKLGRAQRLFSKEQRRVLMQRDRHCRAPGCDIPASWCEVHHVVPWQEGGYTDVTNGILLCSYHHHEIDRGRLTVQHASPESSTQPRAHWAAAYRVKSTWEPALQERLASIAS